MEEYSKGINISKRSHFDKIDNPIGNKNQIGYRLMNLILYSHFFTNILFNNKEKLFSDAKTSHSDYIVSNRRKLKFY